MLTIGSKVIVTGTTANHGNYYDGSTGTVEHVHIITRSSLVNFGDTKAWIENENLTVI